MTGALLARLVAGVRRVPWLVLAAGALLAAVSAWAAATRLEYRTGRDDLMDPHQGVQRRWHQYLAEFGDDDDVVVVVRGTDRAAMTAAIDRLAAAIAARPDKFDRLFYRVDLRPLRDRALLHLPAAQIEGIRADLVRMAPLLSYGPLAWRWLTVSSLVAQARRSTNELTLGEPPDAATEQFFTQMLSVARSAADTLADPAAYRTPWSSLLPAAPAGDSMSEPQYFFSGDGSLAFLLARPVKDAASFTPARDAVVAVRGLVAGVRPAFPGVEIGLTGLPVLEDDEMSASQADSSRAGWLALAGVALLYLVVYRGLRYPLLTVVTLLAGTGWAMGWLTVTVGHLNILSTTFAVMLIGLGDYGVLWVTRYDRERSAGADHAEALRLTAVHAGPGIVTAAAGTALAFYATMLADFRAVAELGWIAGSGVLLCAVACFTVLPAMQEVTERWRPAGRPRGVVPFRVPESRRGPWLGPLARRPGAVLAVSAAGTLALACYAGRTGFDDNLLNMQARGLESVHWEMELIDRTAGASWHALSIAAGPGEALALKARYEKLPEVSRVVEVASLVPADQGRKLELLRDITDRLRYLPKRGGAVEQARPDVRALANDLTCLVSALEPHAVERPGPTLGPLLRELKRLRERLVRTPEATSADRLKAFGERMTADLIEDLHRLRGVSRPAPVALADLPAGLRERYVGATGKWLVRAFARDCLWDRGPLEQFVGAVRAVDPDATGKPFRTLEGLRTMKAGFAWAGVYALGAILLVLWLDFRSAAGVLLALVPLVIGAVAALGVMVLAGVPLNPANMIALPLVVGVGVDNGVHVLHDHAGRRPGEPYSLGPATGRGILVAALTTVLGFGALMTSTHRGLVSLGFALALGVACCMAAALVVLPALLRLTDRRDADARRGRHRAAA